MTENEIGTVCLMRDLIGIAVGTRWFAGEGIGWVFKVI
jgi:hypothetical protein